MTLVCKVWIKDLALKYQITVDCAQQGKRDDGSRNMEFVTNCEVFYELPPVHRDWSDDRFNTTMEAAVFVMNKVYG